MLGHPHLLKRRDKFIRRLVTGQGIGRALQHHPKHRPPRGFASASLANLPGAAQRYIEELSDPQGLKILIECPCQQAHDDQSRQDTRSYEVLHHAVPRS